MNVVPHAARSWEVLDGGTRYVFHLRDDMRWTDDTPVTAQDFEWTWKHNLAPGASSAYEGLLDDILGVRDYREGRNSDPDSVGVRALDLLTLEVRLITPVAYFIYLVTQPITYPLPRAAIERYGEDWWRPDHIISNGAFRLLEFDASHGLMARNLEYSGEFPGNLDQVEWTVMDSQAAVAHAYQTGLAEWGGGFTLRDVPTEVPDSERVEAGVLLTSALILIPSQSPLDDVRVRQALAHALDREQLLEVVSGKHLPWNGGGLVPPGMAGHSPEIGLEYNLDKARKLLAEASYAGGQNFPVLKYYYPDFSPPSIRDGLQQQLSEHLGIHLEMVSMSREVPWWTVKDAHLQSEGWRADYPDPDNFLRQSSFYFTLRNRGWHHPRFEQLLETAARTPDRARRLAMYREADRILVDEAVVVVPLFYFTDLTIDLLKPWVKGFTMNALNWCSSKNVVIEPH